MDDKFKNKYRISSARASWWNYGDEGNYFVTINTYNKNSWLGDIVNGEMVLSEIGRIVVEEWDKSFDIRTELFCDAFVIMPNHLHAILRIENVKKNTIGNVETHGCASQTQSQSDSCFSEMHSRLNLQNRQMDRVFSETHSRASLHSDNVYNDSPKPIRTPKSISSFIAGFKSAATKRINQYRNTPSHKVWQTRFHDHIIRNTEDFNRISNYISTNVENWEEDCFYQNGMRI